MPGIKWEQQELEWLVNQIKKGRHPKECIPDLNKKFQHHRTWGSIHNKLSAENVGYDHLQKVNQPMDIEDVVETERLKAQNRILKRDNAHLLKNVVSQRELFDLIKDHIGALPPAPYKPQKFIKDITEEHLVVLLGDLHNYEIIRTEQILDLNSYNPDICSKRLKHYANKIIDIAVNKMSGYRFKKCLVAGLGDMVSGIIHAELARTNDDNIIEASVGTGYVVAQFIRDLAAHFDEVKFIGVPGNHGRMEKKPYFKDAYVNWDYVVYREIKYLLSQQKNVTVELNRSIFHTEKIYGYNFLFMHGDNIKSYMGVPFYGINRMIANLRELLKDMEYIVLGHFHVGAILEKYRGAVILNGSTKGPDEYALSTMFTGSQAKQSFFSVHKRKGKTFQFDIALQGEDNNIETGYIYLPSNQTEVL